MGQKADLAPLFLVVRQKSTESTRRMVIGQEPQVEVTELEGSRELVQ